MTGVENWRNLKGYFSAFMDQMEFLKIREIKNLETVSEIENILWLLLKHVERIYEDISINEKEKFLNSCTIYERYFFKAVLVKSMNEQKREVNKVKKQIKRLKNYKSYKIGRKITLPARLVKGGIKCWKQHGFAYTCKLTVKKIVNKVR